MNQLKIAVMGASGQVGFSVAQTLVNSGHQVRLMARKQDSVTALLGNGAEYMASDTKDKGSLFRAFEGVDAVYVMNPPNYMAQDMLEDAKENTANIKEALIKAGVKKIVLVSSVGSHLPTGLGNIFTTRHIELELRKLPFDVGVVRAAWFMENWKNVAPVAHKDGVLPSLLVPLDRQIEMVSAVDIGRVCAEVLMSDKKSQLIELAGPEPISPNQAAESFSKALGKPIKAVPIAKSDIPNVFKGLPVKVIQDWIEMVEGFNSGHIVFEKEGFAQVRGNISMTDVAKNLLSPI